jgi:hypothetical protein
MRLLLSDGLFAEYDESPNLCHWEALPGIAGAVLAAGASAGISAATNRKPKDVKPPKDLEATQNQAALMTRNRGRGLAESSNYATLRQAYNMAPAPLKTTLGA